MKRNAALALGVAATLAATLLWHGPGGAGDRLGKSLEHAERAMLDHAEMQMVGARIQRDPLSRRIILTGPADDFQRSELKRMSEELPGIAFARWTGFADPTRLPSLLVEVASMALACFAAGVILAYVAARRRWAREDAQA